jgi:hypothetical protein
MALVTERITSQNDGKLTVDVIYNNTGQNTVDHFHLSNGQPGNVLLVVFVAGVEQWRKSYAPGEYDIDPVAEGVGSISWKRAQRQTGWSLVVSG